MSEKIVNDLLRELGERETLTISPEKSVGEAARKMTLWDVGALVVTDTDGKVVGIVSERDFRTKVVPHNVDSNVAKVETIMTRKVETVSRNTNLKECEDKMKDLHIRHLPVVENGELIAVVSIRDLLVSTREELQSLVRDLKNYISPFSSA